MAKKVKPEAELQATPLTGKALLQKLKEISHLSRREKARECGYFTVSKGEKPRVNIGGFLNAVLAAKGVSLDTESSKDGRGREASYRVSVHKNGQMVIGAAYTEKMGLQVGDEFEIKLGYKHIHLKQIGSDGEEE
jgi:AbrB-like transcriptional regulator